MAVYNQRKIARVLTVGGCLALTALALQIGLLGSARAQANSGKQDFDKFCAGCHGTNAKGKGPYYQTLGGTPPPDLTVLAKQNGGVFPYKKVEDTIDGTKTFPSHRRFDMPFWGVEFQNSTAIIPTKADKARVHARIEALANYIASLQQH
ncbi:MAG TPA: c-type cytochrome [Candidatus Binataceae bacterium]|nr:c-type cytochrome [Candidatus Binataceae bacterium]